MIAESIALAAALIAKPVMAQAATPQTMAATPAYAAETARNRAIIIDFVRLLYGRKDFRGALEKYVSADVYIQHHPGMADGRDAAMRAYGPLFDKPTTRVDVKQILVDGDRAAVEMVGHMGPADPGSVVINIFRLKNGKIVEHWDVTQAIAGNTPSGHPPY